MLRMNNAILLATTIINMIVVVTVHASGGDGIALYSYDLDAPLGPPRWGDVPVDDNQCDGVTQSPIKLFSNECTTYSNYVLTDGDCLASSLTYTIGYNAVTVAFPTDGSCVLNEMKIPGIDSTYEAIQFHIHAASEHSLDGEYFGAELHIVHKEVGGDRYAVLGIFLEPGLPYNNPEFQIALDNWENTLQVVADACNNEDSKRRRHNRRRELQATDPHLNVYDFVPEGATYYQYTGSLTTPPCLEIVDWNVVSVPKMISVKQFTDVLDELYGAINPATCENFSILNDFGSSSRPEQPLNGRTVRHICDAKDNVAPDEEKEEVDEEEVREEEIDKEEVVEEEEEEIEEEEEEIEEEEEVKSGKKSSSSKKSKKMRKTDDDDY